MPLFIGDVVLADVPAGVYYISQFYQKPGKQQEKNYFSVGYLNIFEPFENIQLSAPDPFLFDHYNLKLL